MDRSVRLRPPIPRMNPLTTARHILAWVEENVDLAECGVVLGMHDYEPRDDDPESGPYVYVQFVADSLPLLESLAARIPWTDGDIDVALSGGIWRRNGTAFGVRCNLTCGEVRS